MGGATGEVTCSTDVSTTFEVWDAVATSHMGSCGEDSNATVVGNLVPAVEFLSN